MNNRFLSTVKSLLRSFLIWLALFLLMQLFASNMNQNIALALLAYIMSKVVYTVYWHFSPKEFITELEDKAILITGCDTGFGNQFAEIMDKKGITVYAGCLFPEGEGAAQLRKTCSNRLKILKMDVTNDEQVQNAVQTVSSSLGNKKLWAVVNVAGIAYCGEIEWSPIETCTKTVEVNAIGPFRVTQAFLPLLRRSQGRVVTIASILGRVAVSTSGTYCMSKYAAVAFSEVLRYELMKWNISVHSVEPFLYSTNITDVKKTMIDVEKNWEATPQEIRDDYGKDYLGKMKESVCLAISIKRPPSKTHEVLDALEHATIGKNPKNRYVPGLVGELWTWAGAIVPSDIYDLVNYFVFPNKVAMKK
ncbi:hypothetical protein C0J52_04192 [Blattella germanica]|nr:hypothetical protein C0J52_04192 [Blattella germanica]